MKSREWHLWLLYIAVLLAASVIFLYLLILPSFLQFANGFALFYILAILGTITFLAIIMGIMGLFLKRVFINKIKV